MEQDSIVNETVMIKRIDWDFSTIPIRGCFVGVSLIAVRESTLDRVE